jgi:methylated-DNA-protein-cysteine methyltransferase related protein
MVSPYAANETRHVTVQTMRLDSQRAQSVIERVKAVPLGVVTTYGDIAPGAPRYAGAVLSACEESDVPWQRVVRADGSLAKGDRQRRLLEREGVPFRGDRVDMRSAWVPPPSPSLTGHVTSAER